MGAVHIHAEKDLLTQTDAGCNETFSKHMRLRTFPQSLKRATKQPFEKMFSILCTKSVNLV